MNNHIEIIKTKETGLFKNYIFKAIPLAFDESMSYYETLCALLSYLKDTIIPTVNNNGDAVIELQNLYDELHDYVEHYFDNLDVEEEINNKLDKMAEDGTLEHIIASYLNTQKIYETHSDMINDLSSLVDGLKVQTLGYNAINDGGGAFYLITENPSDDKYSELLSEGLYAEIIDISSFKQMGKFEDNINVDELNYLLKDEVDLEKNNLVLTDTLTLQDITLKNGYISMGTSSTTTPPQNQVCLLVKSNVIIDKIEFNNIDAYYTILSDRKSSNITIKNCKFIDNAFACVVFDVENENIKVDNCYFNGIKYTNTSSLIYRYLIATGSKYTKAENSSYLFSVRNAEFTNNILLNNPLWEGLDSHGGENIIMRNNYIENCQTGIMANASDTILDNMKHKNIIIENNIIKGNDGITRTGIIAGGTSAIMSENIKINNNDIDNCSDNNNNFGGIKLLYVTNAEIKNNIVTNSKVRGINLGSKCINIDIINNYIENANYAPIVQSGYALINANISYNTLNGKGTCNQGFYNPLEGKGIFDKNIIYNCTSNGINYPNNFNKCFNGSSNSYVQYNDILYDMLTNNALKVSSNYFAFGATNFRKTMTVTGSQNTNHVTCSTVPDEIVKGLSIKINSDEYVVEYTIGNEIYLTTNLTNNYSSASVTPKAPTYTSFS